MPDPMRIRALLKDGTTDVRVLMAHPMENGMRRDAGGQLVPPRFIRDVRVTCGGRTVLAARWGRSVSQNPYLQFRFHGGTVGETLTVAWTDTTGETRSDSVAISVAGV